ncbi:hypothetical protein ACFQ6C_23375 [Streptomyces sp. NPDC056454]|uniref:hypothetical protein n=1 Tax=Streptomyces sp. NPDC056454 TaxID=3345823 RepID=UPI0036A30E39
MILAVPRAGDQVAAGIEQVTSLGDIWPGGGDVVHGQAQDLAFVPGREEVAEQRRQLLEGAAAGRRRLRPSPSDCGRLSVADG